MQLPLTRRIWLSLVGTLLLAVLSSGAMLAWMIHARGEIEQILSANREQAAAIQELRTQFAELNRLSSLYLVDSSPACLADLNLNQVRFEEQLARLSRLDWEPDQRSLMDPIQRAFLDWRQKQESFIQAVQDGHSDEARRILLVDSASLYTTFGNLCANLEAANNRDIAESIHAREARARALSFWVWVSLVLGAGLLSGLSWSFFHNALQPLRRMAAEARQRTAPASHPAPADEVQMVGLYLDSLKADVTSARSRLAQTHNHLQDSEKLATVGRLAAGVAHEIRSPLTSLRMRLFSMQKGLVGAPQFENDIQVMSAEIARLDDIIRNFLEFSRPPAIQLGRYSISLLLDKTVELLRYRLENAGVRLERLEPPDLPPVLADAQQVRQVLINLINNAIDVLPNGGTIQVAASVESADGGCPMVVVRVRDNGPGMSDEIRERIFDPFFSTKSGGAGLGLWIAQRIMAEHGGRVECGKSADPGAVFAVWIPVAGKEP